MNNIISFSVSKIGYNHIKAGKVCEDSSGNYDNGLVHICVVADGHGSDNYPRTDKGSKFAVETAIHCFQEFIANADVEQVMEEDRTNFPLLTQLAKSILLEWYQRVEADYSKNPFTVSELEPVSEKYRKRYLAPELVERKVAKAYGCTLIAFAFTNSYAFGLQIGDGKCVVINADGEFCEPIPWDEDCQLNVTTSICDDDAIDEFRFCVLKKMPTAVFCGSDGIDDSYSNERELYALYRSILTIIAENGMETSIREITEYLPILTRKGSGDDVSVSGIIDLSQLEMVKPLLDIQTELFKLNEEVEENEKKRSIILEKMDVLHKKMLKELSLGKGKLEIKKEYDELWESSILLEDKIEDIKFQANDLEKRRQDILYEKAVASFTENEGGQETEETTSRTSATNLELVDVINENVDEETTKSLKSDKTINTDDDINDTTGLIDNIENETKPMTETIVGVVKNCSTNKMNENIKVEPLYDTAYYSNNRSTSLCVIKETFSLVPRDEIIQKLNEYSPLFLMKKE